MAEDENQISGPSSTKKSMLEQLTEHYEWNLKMENGGHCVGYYSEVPEKVQSEYFFPKGKFTLRRVHERFCKWDYDPCSHNPSDTFKNNP